MDGATLDREDVRLASLRLPERQRAVLELHDRKGLSYEQVATSLGIGVGAVAQLIARARINLYDELRGTALASIAAPSAECERALPLIAEREDGELDASSEDATWLDSHLPGCDRCRLAAGQMGEAAASYNAAVAGPEPAIAPPSAPDGRGWNRRSVVLAATALAALALGGLVAIVVGDGGASQADRPAAATGAGAGAVLGLSDARPVRTAKRGRDGANGVAERGDRLATGTAQASADGPVSTPVSTSAPATSGDAKSGTRGGGGSSGKVAVQPTRQTSTPKPASNHKPQATSAQTSQPASQPTSGSTSTPLPTEEATPSGEEPAAEHGHKGEPPGKPADRPPGK